MKPLGQQMLHHRTHGCLRRRLTRRRDDVIAMVKEPVWPRNLIVPQIVGPFDQELKAHVPDVESIWQNSDVEGVFRAFQRLYRRRLELGRRLAKCQQAYSKRLQELAAHRAGCSLGVKTSVIANSLAQVLKRLLPLVTTTVFLRKPWSGQRCGLRRYSRQINSSRSYTISDG